MCIDGEKEIETEREKDTDKQGEIEREENRLIGRVIFRSAEIWRDLNRGRIRIDTTPEENERKKVSCDERMLKKNKGE